MSSENALAELRLTTRAEQARVEDILRLTEPMTLARYATIMSGFDAFLRVWEPRIHDALPARLQQWFRTRRRGGLASADVEWLRAVEGVETVAPSAHLAATLPFGDLAEVLGSLYVIEGPALGSPAIAPRLKATLGLGAGHGASYFHGFGGETAAMWANFRVLASLEIGDSPRNTMHACQSAKRTFAALIELFAPLAPPAIEPAFEHPSAPPHRAGAAGGARRGRPRRHLRPATEADMDASTCRAEGEATTRRWSSCRWTNSKRRRGHGDTMRMPL